MLRRGIVSDFERYIRTRRYDYEIEEQLDLDTIRQAESLPSSRT